MNEGRAKLGQQRRPWHRQVAHRLELAVMRIERFEKHLRTLACTQLQLPPSRLSGCFMFSLATLFLRLACFLGACLIMAFISYRLFAGITLVGMQGFDTFVYWDAADRILQGRTDFYADRLAFYAFNVLAMKLLGINDYALRLFVGAAAVINIGLVYFLSYRVCVNAMVALAVTAVYAFNPTILLNSGMELPHIYGATLVVAAAITALYAIDPAIAPRLRSIYIGLTGFFLALAAFTHEDLIILALAFAVLLGLMVPRKKPLWAGASLRSVLSAAMYFGSGFVFGVAGPMVVLGIAPDKVFHDIYEIGSDVEQTTVHTWEYFGVIASRMLHNVVSESLGPRLSIIAGIAIPGIPLAYAVFRTKTLKAALVLEAVALTYSFGFLLAQRNFETNYNYSRVFVPVTGLIVVFSICGLYLIAQSILEARVTRGYASFVTTLLICTAAALVVAGYHPASYQPRAVSISRNLYNGLKNIVTSQRRLLLPACSAEAAVSNKVGVSSEVYLGRRVVSLLTTPVDDFDSFLAAHSIRYVLVPGGFGISAIKLDDLRHLFSIFYGAQLPANVERSLANAGPAVYHRDRVNLTLEACAFEAATLRRKLLERHSRVIVSLPNGLGDVYELPP